MEGGPFAGVALDPNLSAHQLSQAFGNRQAQPGAAVVASRGGINLLKRFEQAVLPVQRDADAGVTHGEMEQPLFRMADKIGVLLMSEWDVARAVRRGGDFDHDLALMGKLNGVADQIDKDLAQPRHVADQNLRNGVVHQAGQVDSLLGALVASSSIDSSMQVWSSKG